MVYAVVAIAFVGVLSLLNLVLTLGVIRRLREHTDLLSRSGGAVESGAPGLAAGALVGDFAAVVTTEGIPITRDRLANRSLVGFFMDGCEPCKEELPKFAELAREFPRSSDSTYAVLSGGEEGVANMAAQLSTVAHLIVADEGDDLSDAFAVKGFPCFFLVGEAGVVQASAFKVAELPMGVPA